MTDGDNLHNQPQDGKRPRPRTDWTVIHLQGSPAVKIEFAGTGEMRALFAKYGLNLGRCLGSKAAYRRTHRLGIFFPNANVCSARSGKLWWGDLDLNHDAPALECIARRLKQKIYVLREGDARWDQADVIGSDVIGCAVWCSGGDIHVRGLAAFIKRSGLTATVLAKLMGIPTRSLMKRHLPAAALELGRRVEYIGDYFSRYVRDTDGIKWDTGCSAQTLHWAARPRTR